MTKRILYMAILLMASLMTNKVMAASFDCKKAVSTIEKMICADSRLSSLDEELQKGYQNAMDVVKPSVKQKLIAEQRNWITYVRNICADGSCLSKVYTARIDLLAKTRRVLVDNAVCSIPDGGSCRSVVYFRDPSYRMASFNQSLVSNKRSARVIGCERLIDLPVGFANSNDSFGGYCTIMDGTTRSRVVICNDDMIGHFAMKSLKENEDTDRNLIDFTNENCFG
jgi:uncharacterized protein YecT (DUF1311 family)